MTDEKMEELLEGIDGAVWKCKAEGCHETCDSHPCLIEKEIRSRSGE